MTDKPTFVYVTYIESTPEKVWQALTDPDLTAQYWGHSNVSDWDVGSHWEHQRTDGTRIADVSGTVLESAPPVRACDHLGRTRRRAIRQPGASHIRHRALRRDRPAHRHAREPRRRGGTRCFRCGLVSGAVQPQVPPRNRTPASAGAVGNDARMTTAKRDTESTQRDHSRHAGSGQGRHSSCRRPRADDPLRLRHATCASRGCWSIVRWSSSRSWEAPKPGGRRGPEGRAISRWDGLTPPRRRAGTYHQSKPHRSPRSGARPDDSCPWLWHALDRSGQMGRWMDGHRLHRLSARPPTRLTGSSCRAPSHPPACLERCRGHLRSGSGCLTRPAHRLRRGRARSRTRSAG